MRYHALAADYDGTLAHRGVIDDATWVALKRFRESGRKLVMVTGRQLDELLAILGPSAEGFDRIVAENGALIYEPATKEVRILAEPPPEEFVQELERRGVDRVSCGRVIVATWEPHEDTVFHVIHEQGLGLQVIFNKGAVMVLPSGVNKATGLVEALRELGLSPHNVVAIGDAENDHSLLASCECGVAVANALPVLKDKADVLTRRPHGAGVCELIEHVLRDDLAAAASRLQRHHALLGHTADGMRVGIDPYAANIMVCGTSGSGKSTLTTGLLERLASAGYQFAIIDPEGDFTAMDPAVVLGGPQRAPLVEEVLDVLDSPGDNVVVNMLGVALEHRPEFFVKLLPAMADLRSRTGRPHWVIVDEAHHLLPAAWGDGEGLSLRPHGTIYITVHPGSVAAPILETIDTVIAVGGQPDETMREFCHAANIGTPKPCKEDKLPTGTALYWRVGDKHAHVVRTEAPKSERMRHSRKYTEGNLGQDRSFYFKGRDGKLNLKAHNLQLFLHIGDGVDDETWLYHLQLGDYSKWLRTEVKDEALADEVAAVEQDAAITAPTGRAAIRSAVEKRYTLPADKPSGVVDAPIAVLAAAK
ncbi:MAG: HAD-IIB family hydrolase [Deltaproteobacteria bacterium]|nr:HAD-IIB family hydrolase [Deltaproteobacteria bacterium]MDQ3299050.1 HAD-IIB family hydrolase [Myxococcota bacterium]